MRTTCRLRLACTLPDLLLGTAIVGVGLALLIPAVQQYRETARRNQCSSNLKIVGAALQAYHEVHGRFPPAGSAKNELSWHVLVLPTIGYDALFVAFDLREGPYYSTTPNNKNNPHGLVQVPEYLCPSGLQVRSLSASDAVNDVQTHTVHYYGIMGPRGENPVGESYRMSWSGPFAEQGLLGYETRSRITDVSDGISKTFAVGEISWDIANGYRTWVRGAVGDTMSGAKNVRWPINVVYYGKEFTRRYVHYIDDGNASGFNDISLGSEHPGGTQLLMCDGGVKFVPETVDEVVYRSAASIDGGEREPL